MTNNDDIRAAVGAAAMEAVQARPRSLTNRRQRGPAPSMKRLSISMPADLTKTVEEALALTERPSAPALEKLEMNELIGRTLGTWEFLHDRSVTTQPPPSYRKSETGGRRKRTMGALGELIRHCFGTYTQWRGVQSES